MAGAESKDTSNTRKGWRRWIRFRFALRTLLLVTAVVAVLLSFEARRARDQRELAARLDALGGQYAREPRDWIPESARRLLSDDMSATIDGFSLEIMQVADGRNSLAEKLTEPAEIESLLAMPAMAHVWWIKFKGTPVTDGALDELAALNLEVLGLDGTAVTNEARLEWADAHPDCCVNYHPLRNGPEAGTRRQSTP